MLSSACAEHTEAAVDQVSMRNQQENDTQLQGPGLFLQGPGLFLQGPGLFLQGPGLFLQGPGLFLQGPGLFLQGISFNGPGLFLQGPGLFLQGPGLFLQGTLLSGVVIKDGVTTDVEGLDFIGAEMTLGLNAMVDGEPMYEEVILRINDIEQSAEQDDVYLYDLTYRAKNSDQWLPYCGDNGAKAIPLSSYWDVETGDRIDNEKVVTFACTNAVLAKCALWGYRPWATKTQCTGKGKKKKCVEVSLRDHHQACTRMARADFCGDGTPYTVDGTAIDVYDNLNIQTQFTDWPVEAEWTPEGASCVNFVRHPELGYPECFLKKGKPMKFNDCDGKLKGEGELIVSAFSAEGDDEDEDGDGKCSD
jgi:hypothetical protein